MEKKTKTSIFRVNCELPDLNTIISESKKGRYQYQPYAMMKRRFTWLVATAAKSAIKEKYKKVDISIHWICKDKRKDKDNIMAGAKFILDGIVEAGIISNDGWSQIGSIKHDFSVDKNNPGVEVILEESNGC